MSKYRSLILSTLIGLAIAVALFCWGYVNEGYIRMILGGLIALAMIKSGIGNYNYIVELNNWIKKNQNALIIFYPTTKEIQEKIKDEFIPNIPFEFQEVFYDGPTLVGDIKKSIVKELMNRNNQIKVNEPSALKIIADKIEIEPLAELMKIKETKIDYNNLIRRIERLKEGI
ncbi:MAG: hypothetical protein QNK23_14440 [Crocinitomicaceae bacterium]|nr:hypothetical protein [Crocinitomicaceae bacterium]